jgi:hypothetical protein
MQGASRRERPTSSEGAGFKGLKPLEEQPIPAGLQRLMDKLAGKFEIPASTDTKDERRRAQDREAYEKSKALSLVPIWIHLPELEYVTSMFRGIKRALKARKLKFVPAKPENAAGLEQVCSFHVYGGKRKRIGTISLLEMPASGSGHAERAVKMTPEAPNAASIFRSALGTAQSKLIEVHYRHARRTSAQAALHIVVHNQVDYQKPNYTALTPPPAA